MRCYIIALPRFASRYAYITTHTKQVSNLDFEIVGIDGYALRIDSDSDKSEPKILLTQSQSPMSPGQIGCALSHASAYAKLVASGEKCALVVEDDVEFTLPPDKILAELAEKIQPTEVILLYNRNRKPEKYVCDRRPLKTFPSGSLATPVSVRTMRTTACYMIGAVAASRILEINGHAKAPADDWQLFHAEGAFDSIKLLAPMICRMRSFPSTIGYLASDSPLRRLASKLSGTSWGRRLLDFRRNIIVRSKERNIKII